MAREVRRELGVQVDWFLSLRGRQGKCLNKEGDFLAQFGQEHAHGAQDGSLLCKKESCDTAMGVGCGTAGTG